MNAKNPPTGLLPQQNRSNISHRKPHSPQNPSSPLQAGVPTSKAFSIWMEEFPEDRTPAKIAIDSGKTVASKRGMPLFAQVMLSACLCIAVWWAFSGELRISELDKQLEIAGRDMAAFKKQSQADAEQAQSAFDALSKRAKAAEEQSLAQIQELQGDLHSLAKISAAEKQQLEAAAEAVRMSAAKMEARLREDLAGLMKSKAALEGEVAKQRESIAADESKIAELTRQKTDSDSALQNMTAQYEATESRLDELKVKSGKLAEMVQASEADRQAGAAEIARNKTCIGDLQKLVETGEQSVKALEAERTTLGVQIADARQTMDELVLQKSEMEQSFNTATAEVTALKGRIAETENKAAAESARLTDALAASERAMADTRASLSQEMEASRAEVGAALVRIEKLAASFGNNATTSKTLNSQASPIAQAGDPTQSATGSIDNPQ